MFIIYVALCTIFGASHATAFLRNGGRTLFCIFNFILFSLFAPIFLTLNILTATILRDDSLYHLIRTSYDTMSTVYEQRELWRNKELR